jgi:hypothetical protein
MYDLLSTIALYGHKSKFNVIINCDDEEPFDTSANIYHEFGPVEFVTQCQYNESNTKFTSVTEVKKVISSNFSEVKKVISSNLSEVVVDGKIYQFFAQLSVAVE